MDTSRILMKWLLGGVAGVFLLVVAAYVFSYLWKGCRDVRKKLYRKESGRYDTCFKCGSRGNSQVTITSGPLWQELNGPARGEVTIVDRVYYCTGCDLSFCRRCSDYGKTHEYSVGHKCPDCGLPLEVPP